MFQIIGVAIVGLIAAVLGLASTKSDEFRVRRSARINAPPDRIFAFINDFHRWAVWSPYERMDPAMKKTYSGSDAGKGAVYEWEGNNKVGKGRMEITDTAAPAKVSLKLHFVRPFESHSTTEFTLDQKGQGTEVTWSMVGPSPLMTRVMGVFVNMDKMIGKDFEKGLQNLKAAAEAA